jgi:hypothetical protein
MPTSIAVNISVSITNGPSQLITHSLPVDAYDMIKVKVPDTTTDMKVELQPGAADQVRLLVVSCDRYSDKVSYKVNDATEVYPLDSPHVLVGLGGVKMLDSAPTTLKLSNASGGDIQVAVLIGRKAT